MTITVHPKEVLPDDQNSTATTTRTVKRNRNTSSIASRRNNSLHKKRRKTDKPTKVATSVRSFTTASERPTMAINSFQISEKETGIPTSMSGQYTVQYEPYRDEPPGQANPDSDPSTVMHPNLEQRIVYVNENSSQNRDAVMGNSDRSDSNLTDQHASGGKTNRWEKAKNNISQYVNRLVDQGDAKTTGENTWQTRPAWTGKSSAATSIAATDVTTDVAVAIDDKSSIDQPVYEVPNQQAQDSRSSAAIGVAPGKLENWKNEKDSWVRSGRSLIYDKFAMSHVMHCKNPFPLDSTRKLSKKFDVLRYTTSGLLRAIVFRCNLTISQRGSHNVPSARQPSADAHRCQAIHPSDNTALVMYASAHAKHIATMSRNSKQMKIGGHESGRRYTCDNCSRAFPTLDKLQKHSCKRWMKAVKDWKCKDCGKTFVSGKRYLEDHILSVHMGTSPYVCDVCTKGFASYNNYKRHMLVHTGDKPYQCQLCGKSFNQHCNLVRHGSRFHSIATPGMGGVGDGDQRPEAQMETVTEDGGQISVMDSETESLRCPVCYHSSFQSREVMLKHLESCKEKPKDSPRWVCDVCGKFFRSGKKYLEDHINTVHRGLPAHECPVCGKGFVSIAGYKSHLVLHTSNMPFNCFQCQKGFAQKGNFVKHMKTFHNTDVHVRPGIRGRGDKRGPYH
eukprot:gene7774-8620_t